jgi:hypothetical protein
VLCYRTLNVDAGEMKLDCRIVVSLRCPNNRGQRLVKSACRVRRLSLDTNLCLVIANYFVQSTSYQPLKAQAVVDQLLLIYHEPSSREQITTSSTK